jgi:serine/threonine-protein kinase HipA
MVFNIFVTNDDDHLRNHAFLRDPKQGAWSLSPLYDVMPRAMFSTERFLHLGIGPEGRLATIDNAYASKEQFNISSRDALGIIDRIWRTVRQWKLHFEESGVSNNQIEIISKAFRHLNDITSPNLRQKLLTR